MFGAASNRKRSNVGYLLLQHGEARVRIWYGATTIVWAAEHVGMHSSTEQERQNVHVLINSKLGLLRYLGAEREVCLPTQDS